MSEYTVTYHLDENICYCEKCWEYHNVKIPVAIYVKQNEKEKVIQDLQKIKTKRSLTKYLISLYKNVKGRDNKRKYWYTCILHDDKENELWMQNSYEDFLLFKKDVEILKKQKVHIDKNISYNWNKELLREFEDWFLSKIEFLEILIEINENPDKKDLKELNLKNKYTKYFMNAFVSDIFAKTKNKGKICEKFVWIFEDDSVDIPKSFRHLKKYLLSFNDSFYPFIKENYPTLNISISDSSFFCEFSDFFHRVPSFLSCNFYDIASISTETIYDNVISFLNCNFYGKIYVKTIDSHPIRLVKCNTIDIRYMFEYFSQEGYPNKFGNIYSTNIYGECLVEIDDKDAKFYMCEDFNVYCGDVEALLRFINEDFGYYYSLAISDIQDTNFYGGLNIDSYISFTDNITNTHFYGFKCLGYLGEKKDLPRSLRPYFTEKICACIWI